LHRGSGRLAQALGGMKIESLLQVVQFGWWAVALGLPLLLLAVLRRPRKWRWRSPLAVLMSWVALLFYTSEVYFPIGIKHAMQQGADNPYHGFDNNNFVPIFVLGWLLPAAACAIVALSRWALQNHRDGKREAAA